MSLLSRLFGKPKVKGKSPDHKRFPMEVVGESYYQKNLEAICGKRTEEGEDRIVTAVLIPYDSNSHDPMAVRVEIQGKIVGHLSREMARKYRTLHSKVKVQCQANIRGGWRRSHGDIGHYGVRLDLPM